jgi:hypothetical protein
MDPAGNTATSIGTVQPCARINENNIQDADEDGVDSVDIHVVTGPAGIPSSHPLAAFSFDVSFPAPHVYVAEADIKFLLNANPGSDAYDPFPQHPDFDGSYSLEAADSDTPPEPGETGPGTLARITLVSTSSATHGVYPLSLREGGHIDSNNVGHTAANAFHDGPPGNSGRWYLPGATVAIGQPCPDHTGNVDLSVTGFQITPPAAIYAGLPATFQVQAIITNNGPAPVSVYHVKLVGGVGAGGVGSACLPAVKEELTSGPVLAPSTSAIVNMTYNSSCGLPGPISLVGRAAGIPGADPDPNLSNNVTATAFSTGQVLPLDADSDGISGPSDECPNTIGAAVDSAGCSDAQVDPDEDAICDPGAPSGGPSGCTGSDNCPSVPNPNQLDSDNDGTGDVCEAQSPVAVGGIMGLLDAGGTPAEAAGSDRASPPLALAALGAALLLVAFGGASFAWARVRRKY